jgi:acetyl-CoA carboxylase carboxyltransferase component
MSERGSGQWDDVLDELSQRRLAATAMGGPDRVERQHARGRLTVRERLDALLDEGSWREIGGLSGRVEHDDEGTRTVTPSNVIIGRGRIDARPVAIQADDFTVRGGAGDAGTFRKQAYPERMAREMGMPLVRLIDGTGGGGSVKSLLDMDRTYLPGGMLGTEWQLMLDLDQVPVISLALGPVAGLGAARVVASHVAVMVRGTSQVCVAGPAVVKAALGEDLPIEELGGWKVSAGAGTVDLVAESEEHAFQLVRDVLSYLPQHCGELASRLGDGFEFSADEQPALREAVPRDRRAPYNMRFILATIFDDDSLMELGAAFGPSTICALARLDGFAVAVVASDPRVYAGAMTADGADKLARFVDLADTFSLPVVHIVDQPGFLIGGAAERAGTIRRGARALSAINSTAVPWCSVIIRKAFGVGGAAHQPRGRHTTRMAWPSADWGSLPIEGGLEVAYRRELEAAGDGADALKAEILGKLEAVRSPMRTAEAFDIEDIIDPAQTRPLLVEWAHSAYDALGARGGQRTRPVFRTRP